ncbi:stress protein [Paenibacillus terrae]|uniref:Stress protein n=1 Tax=Paenibacillus terrae TaxID=159743 RepID=A0A4U2PVA1_9BACL|nr:stress protein [Paenibacillus terrae]TKH43417.1 stress protein [Paenibacillus terrae]
MKTRIGILILMSILVLPACTNKETMKNPATSRTTSTETTDEPTTKVDNTVTADDVVSKFKTAGLEAENIRGMKPKDYGPLPMKAKSATVFYLPSIGKKNNGHVFVFENNEDLKELKSKYDDMGKESAMFFSYTYAKNNILLHMTGQATEEQFKKYQDVVDSL